MAVIKSVLSVLLPKVRTRRGPVIPVGTQTPRTGSTASDSKSISSIPHRFRFNPNRRTEFCSCGRIGWSEIMNRPQAPTVRRILSRYYAVAQPFPVDSDFRKDEEAGMEEVMEGCRVRHGELWNEDVKIHYVECGDKNGELVVLIHGFPNFWYRWKHQFLALAESGYHVVAPDLRGYNSSSRPKGIQHYGRCSVVSDMVRIIDGLSGGQPATVVGHDWGGFVTWALAEDFPDKVKKAIIVNVPHATVFSEVLSFPASARCVGVGFFQLPWVPEWFMTHGDFKALRASFSSTKFQPEDVDRHVRAYQKAGAMEGPTNYYRAAVRGYWSPPSDAPKPLRVELPVVLIWGELDTFLGRELAVIPKMIAPNSEVKHIPHCSHWPMWDDPVQFNSLLLESITPNQATPASQVHNTTRSTMAK